MAGCAPHPRCLSCGEAAGSMQLRSFLWTLPSFVEPRWTSSSCWRPMYAGLCVAGRDGDDWRLGLTTIGPKIPPCSSRSSWRAWGGPCRHAQPGQHAQHYNKSGPPTAQASKYAGAYQPRPFTRDFFLDEYVLIDLQNIERQNDGARLQEYSHSASGRRILEYLAATRCGTMSRGSSA